MKWFTTYVLLSQITKKLDHIIKTMATQADLDAAIKGLSDDLAVQAQAIDTAVQAIIDKIASSGAAVDLQPEIDALKAVQTSLDAVQTQLPATPTPPAPPAPPAAQP